MFCWRGRIDMTEQSVDPRQSSQRPDDDGSSGAPQPQSPKSALQPGSTLLAGRYVIERPLHTGSRFSIVYLARDCKFGRLVVVKEHFPRDFVVRDGASTVAVDDVTAHDRAFEDSLEDFLRECRMLAQLPVNPNIVQVYDILEENDTAYLIMQYVEGSMMSESQPPNVTAALAVIRKIADALAVIHSVSIDETQENVGVLLHRDIKPQNVILRADDLEPVLVDFGAARFAIDAATRQLTRVFTPGYAPPEQLSMLGISKQGPWSDLYALAATVSHWITGEAPISAEERSQIKEASGKDPVMSMSALVSEGYPEALLTTLQACMQLDPVGRPQSVSEFLQRSQLNSPPAEQTGKRRKKSWFLRFLFWVWPGLGALYYILNSQLGIADSPIYIYLVAALLIAIACWLSARRSTKSRVS